MANKKINELSVRTPSLSDLMLVGDPSTGYSYKATISSLSTLLEANIALNDLSDVVITSVANGNLLAYNGTNWVNRTLGSYLGGTITQYVRGDGSLGDFSGSGGGGGASVSYYLNGSINQGSFGGTTYYEMNKTPIAGAGTNFTINANGYIASFITDAGDPALLKIPGGNWNLEFYFSSSSAGGTPSFYVELYKYDGTTFTLIASNSASPEGITNGTAIDAYFTSLSVPETVLTLTDRLAIRVYVTHSGRTITLHTENSHLCQIITTFTTGLTALNNLTAQVQFFSTGTSGTDFAISSTTATHTFNLPTASATNRGALSSADWTTFNGKVGGSGTTNYVSKFTASGTIGNSQIQDNGTSVGIGTATPTGFVNINYSNTDYTNTNGANSHILLSNANASGQTSVTAVINSAVRAKWRTDVVGNINWVSYANSNTLGHYFYVNGDYGVGKYQAVISNTGTRFGNNLSISAIVYPFEVIGKSSFSDNMMIGTTTDAGYKLDVNGTARFTGSVGIGMGSGLNALQVRGNFYADDGNGYYGVINATNGGWFISNQGNSAARISSTFTYFLSNTAIGTSTDAGYRLDVSGTFRSTLDANINGLTVGKGLASVSQNTAFGVTALASNTTGNAVTAIGYQAGNANTTSSHNTYIGNQSGRVATGANNTFVGSGSGQANIGGAQNTFLGTFAGYDVTSGTYNTLVGYNVGRGLTTGNYNTIIGGDVTGLSASLSNTIILADGQGNQRFTINSSGNAGILTTSPTNLLTLVGSTTGRGIDFVSQANFASVTGKINYETTNDLFSIINTSSWGNSALIFGTNNTERMRLTQGGNLLLGTTTNGGQLLQVNGTIGLPSGSGAIYFNPGANTFAIYKSGTDMYFNGGTGWSTFGGNTLVFTNGANTTEYARINSSGNMGIGTNSPSASSILHLSSTTKGFLPPVMTGAQAEAITGPAFGLLVYVNSGNGTTITSVGWWGYNSSGGGTWVKLN
jgi:hypothetical protein